MSNRIAVEIKKRDAELQVVFGEIFAPGVTDSQGDRMSAEEIQKAAYRFMQAGRLAKVDTNHDRKVNGSHVVESFIARDGDPTFIPGSWVVGVKVPDAEIWSKIKTGELNGFSLDGLGFRERTIVKVEIPDQVSGDTYENAGHSHRFFANFRDGKFVGGETDIVLGHSHRISKGTATDTASGHSHRYSFAELLLDV
jgi:hypothetical protein